MCREMVNFYNKHCSHDQAFVVIDDRAALLGIDLGSDPIEVHTAVLHIGGPAAMETKRNFEERWCYVPDNSAVLLHKRNGDTMKDGSCSARFGFLYTQHFSIKL